MHELFLYDEIGPEWLGMVSAEYVLSELAHAGKSSPVIVRINSPGGSVTEGQAIYNALRRHGGPVTVEVDGLAASIASYIAMAGKKINIAENGMFMVHSPWVLVAGDSVQLRKQAAILDKFEEVLLDAYTARTGKERSAVQAMLKAETWLNATESVQHGFADAVNQHAQGPAAKSANDDMRSRIASARKAASA